MAAAAVHCRCQEWHGGSASCEVGGALCDSESLAAQVSPPPAESNGWNPPLPLPWAYTQLLKPGRSAFTGGASSSGSAGYAGWSSQPALPFQTFAEEAGGALSSGAARINTNLRCGSVLPVTLKFGVFSDLTGDGHVGQNDAVVYARNQYPLADWIYRVGLIFKLDNDMTSYTGGEGGTRISFNDSMQVVRKLSAFSDNTTTVLHLVGWQGSGHDTLYPSLDQLNRNVGTEADLRRLAEEAKKFNVVISYHINTDEA